MTKIPLSAIVLTKNEEELIENCLKSLSFCKEIIVIDDESSDKTREIAKSYGARVIPRKLDNNWAKQRNFGLEKAKFDWVLFVDADEIVAKPLEKEIKEVVTKSSSYIGYFIGRQDVWFGKKLNFGENGRKKLLRLALKGHGRWVRRVHETWEVKGRIGSLHGKLIHQPNRTISEFVANLNTYSTLHARENLSEGKKSSVIKIVIFPVLKFMKSYIFRLGFLDGVYGFLYATFMSWHSFLSWAKLLTIQKN